MIRAAWVLFAVAVVLQALSRVRMIARFAVDPWWRRQVVDQLWRGR